MTCVERTGAESDGVKKVDNRGTSIIEWDNAERHSCAKLSEQLHMNGLSSWL